MLSPLLPQLLQLLVLHCCFSLLEVLLLLPCVPFARQVPEGFSLGTALGWKFIGFFIFNLYMTVCSLMVSTAVFAVFALLSFTELCLFVGLLGASEGWITAGGYFGIVTAFAAFYASFAVCFNKLAGRPVIYVGGPMLSFKP